MYVCGLGRRPDLTGGRSQLKMFATFSPLELGHHNQVHMQWAFLYLVVLRVSVERVPVG